MAVSGNQCQTAFNERPIASASVVIAAHADIRFPGFERSKPASGSDGSRFTSPSRTTLNRDAAPRAFWSSAPQSVPGNPEPGPSVDPDDRPNMAMVHAGSTDADLS